MTREPWLTVAEASAYSRLSRCTLYRAIESGALLCGRTRGGRAVRLRASDLDRWLMRHDDRVARPVRRPEVKRCVLEQSIVKTIDGGA